MKRLNQNDYTGSKWSSSQNIEMQSAFKYKTLNSTYLQYIPEGECHTATLFIYWIVPWDTGTFLQQKSLWDS